MMSSALTNAGASERAEIGKDTAADHDIFENGRIGNRDRRRLRRRSGDAHQQRNGEDRA
jgi:hypothetical protein